MCELSPCYSDWCRAEKHELTATASYFYSLPSTGLNSMEAGRASLEQQGRQELLQSPGLIISSPRKPQFCSSGLLNWEGKGWAQGFPFPAQVPHEWRKPRLPWKQFMLWAENAENQAQSPILEVYELQGMAFSGQRRGGILVAVHSWVKLGLLVWAY